MSPTVAAFAILAGLLFALSWWRKRQLYLLPSTWILLASGIIYVLPAAVFSDELADMSPYAVKALAYCTTLIVSGLLINLLWARPPSLASLASDSTASPDAPNPVSLNRALRYVLVALGAILLWYLMTVPLKSTGLYGVLFDPEHSAEMREESLKLLTNPALQYIYLTGFSCLCPLALCLMLARCAGISGLRRYLLLLSVIGFLCFYLLLTGARIGLVNLVVAGIFFAFLRNRLRIDVRLLLFGLFILFAVPMVISILREQGRSEGTLFEYVEAIAGRIFLLPLLISGWFVEYADTNGTVGFMQAAGLGQHINWSNLIALEYLGRHEQVTIESVTTPTAYFFSNYLYFGWAGLIPSLAALRVIDLPVYQLRHLATDLRLPIAAVLLFFSVIFVQSGFGVTMLSHGYLLLIALVFAMRQRRYATGQQSHRPIAVVSPDV